ncbi:MAG: Mov34/MPN/PAD-1 family protein [Nitrososphaerales archaeon]|jgi:proteasome lid subunit RPN8/RPN11
MSTSNTKKVLFENDVIEGLLAYCKDTHPLEGILLMRGEVNKREIRVKSLMIPPIPIHSEHFSSFQWHMVPLDASILGIAHSHPNGVIWPSEVDLINFLGRLMAIVGPPYLSEADIGVFDSEGNPARFSVV